MQLLHQRLDKPTLSAFLADDTPIVVVPAFDLPTTVPLLSSHKLGPFRAGIAVEVPLWLAILLKERSLAAISLPDWMNRDGLAAVLQDERRHKLLVQDATRLPFHYYEIARRLAPHTSDPSVPLLVEDILQLRLDKLRQQFQVLLGTSAKGESAAVPRDLLVTVTGIASQELAVLGDFISQALCDVQSLQPQPASSSISSSRKDASLSANGAPSSRGGGAAGGGGADTGTSGLPPPATALRSRLPLRRFRDQ